MKYISLLLTLVLVLFPVSSYAGCADFSCTGGPGPAYGCTTCYYSFDLSCATTSNVTEQTLSCYSWPGHQFSSGSGSIDYEMTVPLGHGSSCKEVAIFVDFTDSSSNSLNGAAATVIARHNGSVIYSENFFLHTGNQGSLECARFDSGTFTAAAGDSIEVSYTGTNYNGATIKITAPLIFD